jgi:peptidoglycan hydrolase-like protein with peptidoglycan-binding domain
LNKMAKNIQKELESLRTYLQKVLDTTSKYRKIFEADGVIDSREQARLDKLAEMVTKIEAVIDEKEASINTSTNTVTSENTPTPESTSTPENTSTPVTGEEVTRLTELVDDIPTTGLNGSVTASENRAKASDAYLKEKEDVLNAAAQEHQMPVSILSAITSRESDGKGALKSLTYFNTTPAKQLQKIKDAIVSKLSGYNYHSIEEFQASKYYKYTLSDMKGLTPDDKVWGDHGFGFGVTQFDIRWHAKKVLDMLALSKSEAEDALIMNASALLAEELDKAKAAHSSWSEAECLQAAIAAYNAGSTIHDGKGNYPKMEKFDADLISARTTGKDYAHDVVARAQYYEENASTNSGSSDSTNTNDNTDSGNTDDTSTTDSGNTDDTTSTDVTIRPISKSVGKGGKNELEDVKIVQSLLKGLGYNLGTSGPNGDGVDGNCGNTTIKHIKDFQAKNFSFTPDGLISTTGNTWKKLAEGASTPDPVNNDDTSSDSGNTDDTSTDSGNTDDTTSTDVAIRPISKSVGKGGDNELEDVKIVQSLLKNLGYNLGTSGPNGDGVDGNCGNTTIKHIKDFQAKNFSFTPDGLISKTGNTWKKLSGETTSSDNNNSGESTDSDDTTDDQPVVEGKYFSHKDADSVSISYGANALKMNAQATHLAKSIAAEAGLSSIIISSTTRTYADQGRINYEQNSAAQIKQWYGVDVYNTWVKYKRENRSTAEYAAYLEARDKARGKVMSKHLSGLCLDVTPYNVKFADVCARLVPVAGSGVKTFLKEKGCTHTEFTFKVT